MKENEPLSWRNEKTKSMGRDIHGDVCDELEMERINCLLLAKVAQSAYGTRTLDCRMKDKQII